MSKKCDSENISFKSVKDKLEYIQKNCPETELFEDLRVLFKKKGFNNVKITHGNREFGKDLVFSKIDPDLETEKWYAVIVKNKNASQNDFKEKNEIGLQINDAIKVPYKNEKGEEKIISSVFIIINGKVTENCSDIIKIYIPQIILPHIKIFDYQELKGQIEKYSKEEFLDNTEPTYGLYLTEQIKNLSDISVTNSVFDLKIDDINEIFVNVQTTYSKELKKMNTYVSYEKNEKKFHEEDIEGSDEILNSNENFIVHGIPTSGKTLFLKRIGIKALQEENVKANAVFYFDLQNFNDTKVDILKLINSQYKELTKGDEFQFEEYGKVILLFDGIDFIKDQEHAKRIYEAIGRFSIASQDLYKLQIIIATRNFDSVSQNDSLKHFKDTELLPFNFGQAIQLVKKIIPNNESKKNNFIQALKHSLLNTSLQRTPLALTLLAILYRDDHVDLRELPANIFALYDRFTDVYLDKWDSSKGVSQLYKYDQIKNILSFIAHYLHKEGLNEIAEDELEVFLNELRGEYNYDELNNIPNFIQYLKEQKGVFNYDHNENRFFFFNHYFQEYFTSLSIEDDETSVLIDNFFNTWWSNSVVFYCGKNSKSFKLHKDVLDSIVPLGSNQKAYYINQHSKCLQASHAISISNRRKVVLKMLKEFDEFIKALYTEAESNESAIVNKIPFVNLLNQSKVIFDNAFGSKHIATTEVLGYFEEILLDDNDFTEITNYNLAYFIAFNKGNPFPFEVFSDKVESAVYSRIVYVDVKFLDMKKQMDDKKFIRIRRKMNKKKHIIQHMLSSTNVEMKELKE